jgi:imidazoleglycerol-phosphate dehydratase
MKRKAEWERKTRETRISGTLNLDGQGDFTVTTPLGFLNHMLESFAKHGRFGLSLKAEGDISVDQHHLVEDCGLVLGKLFARALGEKKGINRAGFFVYPMDEALAVVAVDICGRPFLQYDASFGRRFCGELDTDLLHDFFQAFASQLQAIVVVRMPYGRSDHHKIEAIFKAFGKAMRMACSQDRRDVADIPSTKGVIDDDRGS